MALAVLDEDPFADTAFVSRLQKLLAMLASEQPGEAEAARRKLLEHLGSQRLSLTDVAQRLGAGAVKPSFTQATREMSLERQLYLARVARQEIETEAQRAMQRSADLQRTLNDAVSQMAQALAARARLRLLAGSGWIVACMVGALVAASSLHRDGLAQGRAIIQADRVLIERSGGFGRKEPALQLSPGERSGTVLEQDLAIRLSPSEDATVRAFLNRGMRVAVEQQTRVGLENWLLIRSVTGTGWVRSAGVLH
jgi:hypothetical protein